MKKLFFYCIMITFPLYSQTTVKGNVSALLAVPQVGIETSLGKKITFQVDALASLWASFNDAPFDVYMIFPEIRYYPNQSFKGFYVGAHIGGSSYRFQKWNYLNTGLYQDGYSLMYGVTLGYQLKINDRWNLDVFLGGGNQQGYYHGHYLSTGERYETADHWNKSGEWLPYRGGIMFCYKLGKTKKTDEK